MTTIEREIQIAREMHKQGVSSLRLKGPFGDALRAEALPHLKTLAKRGAVAPTIFGILYGMR
jgi:hypothetical protein